MERPRHPGAGGAGAALDRLEGTTRATIPQPRALSKPYGGHGTFKERLATGGEAEEAVAAWLKFGFSRAIADRSRPVNATSP